MLSFPILACIISMVVALLEENDLWLSGSILQARQLDNFLRLPRSFPLQHRESHVGLFPQSNALQRRGTQPRRSGSPGNQGSSSGSQELPRLPNSIVNQPSPGSQRLNRPGSPTIKASALAQGPAMLKVGSHGTTRTEEVPLGQNDIMHDAHPHFSMAKAESRRSPPREGHKPPRQLVEVGAKGQSVMAAVYPGKGGKGRIRVESPHGVRDATVRGGEGEYEFGASDVPGGSRVMAKSYRGGKVTAFAVDHDTTPQRR